MAKLSKRLLPIKAHYFFFMAGKFHVYLKTFSFFEGFKQIVLHFCAFSFHLLSNGSNFATDQCIWQRTWNFAGCHGIHHILFAHSVRSGQAGRRISHRFVPGKHLGLLLKYLFVD